MNALAGPRLPFSEEQFLAVFANYNTDLAAAVVVLWLLTAAALVRLAMRRRSSTLITLILVIHWAWAGAVYHLTYFTSINPAARAFGALFILQAIFFLMSGRLEYRWGPKPRQILSAGFCVYAMLYPALAFISGLRWPAMPTFGVPCPSTLLTVGLLLAVEPGRARWLSAIPLIWTIVGGSAALLLGMTPDFMLLAGTVLLVLNVAAPHALTTRAA